MVNKNKICQKTPLYDGHPGFRSSNLDIYRFKNSRGTNCGCRIIHRKTRYDLKNYANYGDKSIRCGNVQDQTPCV